MTAGNLKPTLLAFFVVVSACSDDAKFSNDRTALVKANPTPASAEAAINRVHEAIAAANPAQAKPASPKEPLLIANTATYTASKTSDLEIILGANLTESHARINFEVIDPPKKGQIKYFDAASGKLIYRAQPGYFGEDSLSFKALTKTLESDVNRIQIKILNIVPSVADLVVSNAKNTLVMAKIAVADPDKDPVTITVRNPSEGVEHYDFDSSSATLSLQPKMDFVGTISFSVTASDSDSISEAKVLKFEFTNTFPVRQKMAVSTVKDAPVGISLAGLGSLTDAIREFSIKELPLDGRIENFDSLYGHLTFIPNANFVGETSFTYLISEAVNVNKENVNEESVNEENVNEENVREGRVHITVHNAAPLTPDLVVSAPKSTSIPIKLELAAVSTDSDGHPLSYEIEEKPKFGLTTLDQTSGAMTYLPQTAYSGADSFTYTAFDGAARSKPGRVSVQIVNANPIFISTPVTKLKYFLKEENTVLLKATVRDFRGRLYHPDFENQNNYKNDATPGLVKAALDAEGKPVLAAPNGPMIVSEASFYSWYRDIPTVNINIPINLKLVKKGSVFEGGSTNFFPINGLGFAAVYPNDAPCEPANPTKNCHFTTELATTFRYQGDEEFTFTGDDDLWVFINNILAVDIGGVHRPSSATIKLKEREAHLGLKVGGEYSFKLFGAERMSPGSNFVIQTSLNLKSNLEYRYKVSVEDPDKDKITLSLLQAPPGLILTSEGVLEWMPAADQLGSHRVSLTATDADGGKSTQTFDIFVE